LYGAATRSCETGQSVRQICIVASIHSVGRSPAIFRGRSAELGRRSLPARQSSGSRCALPRRSPCLGGAGVSKSIGPAGCFRHFRHLDRKGLTASKELSGGSGCPLPPRLPGLRSRAGGDLSMKRVFQQPARKGGLDSLPERCKRSLRALTGGATHLPSLVP
jgi:hypothetical protein